MQKPQLENGYTRIANELLERINKIYLPDCARRVFGAVMRKTYGYNKKRDYISLTQLCEETDLDSRNVRDGIQWLNASTMILIGRTKNKVGTEYEIQKDYSLWRVGSTTHSNQIRVGSQGQKGWVLRPTTKDNTKEIIPNSASADLSTLSFEEKTVTVVHSKRTLSMSKIRAYDENNPGDYERSIDADTGQPIRHPIGRSSKRNDAAQRVAHHFTIRAEQYIGKGKLGPMGYYQAKKIIEEGILTEEQLVGMVDAFFDSSPNDKDALNPYVAFSLQRAREYKLET
jgi:phage replication O-like protein O